MPYNNHAPVEHFARLGWDAAGRLGWDADGMLYFLLSGMHAAGGCTVILFADATRAQLFFVSSGINLI